MRRLWLIAAVWWGATALLGAEQQSRALGGDLAAFVQAVGQILVGHASWIPLTVLIIWLAYRFPIARGRFARHLLLHAAVLMGVIVLRAAWVYLVTPIVGWYPPGTPFTDMLAASVRGNLLLGWMLIAAAHALAFADFRRHDREQLDALRSELQEARFQALSARLNPHFLFNSLSSIAELVHSNPQAADDMLVGLSGLLRRALSTAGETLVPLGDELDMCRQYLALESLRLGERLDVRWDVEDAALAAPVPPLLLQPLVENAVVHAAAQRESTTRLLIAARVQHGRIAISVVDSGDEPVAASAAGSGLGLSSVRERLRHAFGEAGTLSTESTALGTAVQLGLPTARGRHV